MGLPRHEQSSRFESVELRHAHVHDDDIGLRALDEVDGVGTIAGLADHFESDVRVDDRREPGTDQRLIVDD